MRKPSKLVPRTELDSAKNEAFRAEVALNAVLNGTASKAYRVAETIHPEGTAGCSYTFRFVARGNGYDLAIVTFCCSTTGQADSTRVYDVDQQRESTRGYAGPWSGLADSLRPVAARCLPG